MLIEKNLKEFSLEDIEDVLGTVKFPDFVRNCEVSLMKTITDIAYEAAWNPKLKAVFISGPSSSGKTTFTQRLASAIHVYGRPTCSISLDDYYKEGYEANVINGRRDMESIDNIDLELMHEQLTQLTRGIELIVPTYEFSTKRRSYLPEKSLRMSPRGIVLVEGLHSLSPSVYEVFKPEERMTVFVMPNADLFSDKRLLTQREIRAMRRLCRDNFHRKTSALSTLDYWPMLDLMEAEIFPPYADNADVFVNTALAYEFCVMPALAAMTIKADIARRYGIELSETDIIKNISPPQADDSLTDLTQAWDFAMQILRVDAKMPSIPPDVVPVNSILNEFIVK